MVYRERGSHARGVYPTQYTSRMRTASVKYEEEVNTGIIGEKHEIGKKGTWVRKGKVPNKT